MSITDEKMQKNLFLLLLLFYKYLEEEKGYKGVYGNIILQVGRHIDLEAELHNSFNMANAFDGTFDNIYIKEVFDSLSYKDKIGSIFFIKEQTEDIKSLTIKIVNEMQQRKNNKLRFGSDSVYSFIVQLLDEKKYETIYDPAISDGILEGNIVNKTKLYGESVDEISRFVSYIVSFILGYEEVKIVDPNNQEIVNKNFDLILSDIVFPSYIFMDKNKLFDIMEKRVKDRIFFDGNVNRTNIDLAHVLYADIMLKEEGTAVILAPYGSLLRSNEKFGGRKYLIRDRNIVDAIIGLSGRGISNFSNVASVIWILKNNRKRNDIFIANASVDTFDTVANLYKKWEEKEGISSIVNKNTIASYDYNLSVSLYIDNYSQNSPLNYNITEIKKYIKAQESKLNEISNWLKEI